MTTNTKERPTAASLVSPEYRELIETASFDWQVGQFVYWRRKITEHSANEIKAGAIAEIARAQHGVARFDAAVEAYDA